jgi:hypothetical protein
MCGARRAICHSLANARVLRLRSTRFICPCLFSSELSDCGGGPSGPRICARRPRTRARHPATDAQNQPPAVYHLVSKFLWYRHFCRRIDGWGTSPDPGQLVQDPAPGLSLPVQKYRSHPQIKGAQKRFSTTVGFEPTRPEGNSLAGNHVNRFAKSSEFARPRLCPPPLEFYRTARYRFAESSDAR